MDTTAILNELKAERERLDKAITALEGLMSGTTVLVQPKAALPAKASAKRKMQRSPEARARMAAAQKARWARLKSIQEAKPVKKATKKGSKVPF